MSIDNSKKSPRLLQSRRYTHETFTDAQEAFTSVLDINANEVYVDQDLIPASSIPFGTSGDNLSIYSSGGQQVMKYYYRYKMTKSSTNNQVWFFTTGTTAGIDAQLIDSNQQKNFISPKYSIPSLSTANAEDSPAGYGVKVFVSTNSSSPAAGDQILSTKFVFDYKTGVLQFVLTADAPTDSQYLYISTYQYVGRTLKDALVTSVASSSGTSGTSGSNGTDGSSGTSGSSGSSGSNGTDGSSGTSGSNGTDGSSGSSGTSGSNGTDGSSGTSGSNGTDGSSGTSGSNGTDGSSGSNGTDGSSGSNGTDGSSGSNGTDGSSGTSGSNGTDGSSGTSGSNGTDGSSGSNGTDGSSGTSGSNGTDGSSGTSGDSLFADSGSYWTTTNNVEITGSVKIKGVLTAEEYNVTLVSSSVLYSSGSTKFGDTPDDTHQFTGSLFVSGSINIVSGSLSINGTSFSAMTSGTSGSNGTDGSSGTSGSNGTDGTSGSNGTDGSSGTSGSNGTDGTSGSNGTDGSSGTSGSNGTDGSSGTSGDSLFAETSLGSGTWTTTNDIQITGSLSISSQLGINDANVLLNESASLVLTSGSNIYIENGGFITASFKGDGAGLYNIPATGVTGLQLDRIISGSVSASMADGTLRVNTDVNIDGTLTARELHIDYVTSSVLYTSGSTKFGDTADDNHNFTGSLRTSGSVVINGDLTVNGTTVLTSTDLLRESLIVSGAMAIMQAQIQAQMISASLSMQGQRVITYQMDTGSVMDLGGF
jgi:hypothetical protein